MNWSPRTPLESNKNQEISPESRRKRGKVGNSDRILRLLVDKAVYQLEQRIGAVVEKENEQQMLVSTLRRVEWEREREGGEERGMCWDQVPDCAVQTALAESEKVFSAQKKEKKKRNQGKIVNAQVLKNTLSKLYSNACKAFDMPPTQSNCTLLSLQYVQRSAIMPWPDENYYVWGGQLWELRNTQEKLNQLNPHSSQTDNYC